VFLVSWWFNIGFGDGGPACTRARFEYIGRVISPNVLRQATRFHGHLGPWLVLGMKAGAYARKSLAASPFELRAKVFCPTGTPYTCFVDGVQFTSGCTMGKGNISCHRAAGCRVEFTLRNRPGRVRLALRPKVWDELHTRPCKGMAGAARLGREFARRSLSGLFSERSRTKRPPTRAARPASN
jgi:formylmethanofuran dehydrogenase subunit E